MGEIPQTKNTTVGVVDSIIHGAIMDVAVNGAVRAATAAVPFLGFPVISTLFKWGVNWIAGLLSEQLERAAAFAIIDHQTNAQANAYKEAVEELRKLHSESPEDKDAIEKAKKEFKDKLALLIHWDGS